MSSAVPAPANVLGALAAQVLVQTLFFAEVCADGCAELGRRPIWTAPVAALDDYWAVNLPATVGCPMRAQLLLQAEKAGADTAERAAKAWLRTIIRTS